MASIESVQTNGHAPALRTAVWIRLAFLMISFATQPHTGRTQEIPRHSLARQKTAPLTSSSSHIKIGKVKVFVDAGFKAEYIDNISSTSVNPQADITLAPEIGITADWVATNANALRFRTSIGYLKYLDHPLLDQRTVTISPDSLISFHLYAGDVRIEFHDRFALSTETSEQAALSGVASLPRFENTAGLAVVWDLNNVVWTTGYDRYDLITLGSAVSGDGVQQTDLQRLNHTTDQLATSLTLELSSTLLAGAEATVAYSRYPDATDADYMSFSTGVFLEWQATRYTSILLGGGIKAYSTLDGEPVNVTLFTIDEEGSLAPETVSLPGREGGTQMGFYANAIFRHRVNPHCSEQLAFGHEDQADAFSGRVETDYARYSVTCMLGSRISLGLHASLDHIKQAPGSTIGATVATDYRRLTAGISAMYRVSERTDIVVAYQLTRQDSDLAGAGYQQNRFTLRLGYRF